ncbi:hypothetical protein PHPALM_17439 [Phytophthora palmivora]|uniref:Regulator of chromosome condensation (RCC1)-like protein n=1 Tax=Phytophthora palmivora TaxID=4796 RepID=A0A2P4XMD7_9STRA|nr:hypothetical protein PHPALM_17439 [Phytophthora palmivora]
MPRATKASSPTAKNKQQTAVPLKTHENSQLTTITNEIVHPAVVDKSRPASPVQGTRKRVVRRPKYHEKLSFLERESFKGLGSTKHSPTWFPGPTLGESYRVVSTMFQAVHEASQETRPVSWGYGCTDGALGHNNTRRVVEMKRLAIFRRTIIRAISAGNKLSLFLTDDNRVFQSGRLFMKQDGCKMWKPVEIKFEDPLVKIVAVEAGHLAAYAIDDQGRVYSWGTQIFGQLGHGEELEQPSAGGLPVEDSENNENTTDTVIKGEGVHLNHDENEIDKEEREEEAKPPPKIVMVVNTPKQVESLAGYPIVKISAGNHFVLAISSTGTVFSWGRGCFGQLGNGEDIDVSSSTRIDAVQNYVAIDISAGMNHVLGVFVPRDEFCPSNHHEENGSLLLRQYEDALTTERTVVMVWGRGTHGCLGLGGSSNEVLPCENTFFRGLGAAKVAAGSDHSLVLCRAGARSFLYAFGGNQLGQLGIASNADHVDMPSFLDEFANVHVADIGAGAQYSAALTGDGEVFTWGDARYGKTCRADGRTTYMPWNVDLPSTIPSNSFITQFSVGSYHSLAQLRINGAVDRWRKFPLSGIVPAVTHEEDVSKVHELTDHDAKCPRCICSMYNVPKITSLPSL